MFDLLRHDGLLEEELAETLYAMAGFRNVLVHGYAEVDLKIVHDILENHLDDQLTYVERLREAL